MPIMRGAYSATYNGLAVGNTEIGFKTSYSYRGKSIMFDVVGSTPVDVIMDGIDMKVSFVAQEWDAAAINILRWPFFPGAIGTTLPTGQSLWELAKPLLLTACSETTSPETILYPKAILAPDYTLEIDYNHLNRPVPLQLLIFPVRAPLSGEPLMPGGCNSLVYFVETYP